MPKDPNTKRTEKKEKPNSYDEIKELEERIANTKYNKKTQGAIGLYKAKLAQLKEKRKTRAGIGVKDQGFSVRKSGDATVIMVGFPSVGKSTILNGITNAKSHVAAYAFTTLTVIPGQMDYGKAKIQILDVPGIVEGAATGRGRGKEVLSCAMSTDMVMFIVDALYPENLDVIKKEVYETNLRTNQQKPDIKITKKPKGGVEVWSTVKLTKLDAQTIKDILKEFKILNADVVIRSDIDADQLIDVVEGNKKYVPAITVLNKIDLVSKEQLEQIKQKLKPDICISAELKINMEELKRLIFEKLRFIRIYCKETGKKADMDVPMIMFKNSTLRDMCNKLHKDFSTKFKFARVWGKSTRFPGQKILKLDHKIEDNDVIEIHVK